MQSIPFLPLSVLNSWEVSPECKGCGILEMPHDPKCTFASDGVRYGPAARVEWRPWFLEIFTTVPSLALALSVSLSLSLSQSIYLSLSLCTFITIMNISIIIITAFTTSFQDKLDTPPRRTAS